MLLQRSLKKADPFMRFHSNLNVKEEILEINNMILDHNQMGALSQSSIR